MGLVFASVHACAHWRGEMYGEGPGAPTSLSNSVHRGPPAPRIVPSGVSLPPWSPPGLLTFLKACCWISDSVDVTRSSSTLHPGRAGSCRGGKGEGGTL